MSINDNSNSFNFINNGINTIRNISEEFEFLNDNDDLNKFILSFFKTFSTYFSSNKNQSQKIKFNPQIYDAKNDYNIVKIYEKEGKLFLKGFDYENEFDKFFTQINKCKGQKRKLKQSLKNGNSIYEMPLFKTIHLNKLNSKIYEETILNSETKYDAFNSIFFPLNDRNLNKDNDLIFNLNLKGIHDEHGILLFKENKIITKNKEQGINLKNNEINSDMNNNNYLDNKNENFNDDINANNNYCNNNKSNKNSIFFENNEIMIEIAKYNNFIQDNISLFLLNLSNEQNNLINNLTNSNNNDNLSNTNKLNNINEIIKTIDNSYILDLINHFNNIFTPKIYNKFSFFKNIKMNNQSQVLNNINSVLIEEIEKSNSSNKEEEKLMKDIRSKFNEDLFKEINNEKSITQNFTHFYIEGNKFSKDNMKKIISFLLKENFCMFAWSYNKEETKKFGLINNIIKVATLSNKIWFYIKNNKKENN